MYTLFGFKGSGSAAVEAALLLAGAPFRIVDAASWEPGPALDELARANPLRQIPTLQRPDGAVLTESAACLMHLGFAYPGSGLVPGDAPARDLALRGLVYIPANCYSCISVIDYPERYTTATDDASLQAVRAGATARLHRHWEIFADLHPVDDADFIGGARPGALDILAAVVSKWSGTRAHMAAARPAFAALLRRIEADPVLAPVFERHWPAQQ
jgi:GST-like protein